MHKIDNLNEILAAREGTEAEKGAEEDNDLQIESGKKVDRQQARAQ